MGEEMFRYFREQRLSHLSSSPEPASQTDSVNGFGPHLLPTPPHSPPERTQESRGAFAMHFIVPLFPLMNILSRKHSHSIYCRQNPSTSYSNSCSFAMSPSLHNYYGKGLPPLVSKCLWRKILFLLLTTRGNGKNQYILRRYSNWRAACCLLADNSSHHHNPRTRPR